MLNDMKVAYIPYLFMQHVVEYEKIKEQYDKVNSELHMIGYDGNEFGLISTLDGQYEHLKRVVNVLMFWINSGSQVSS